MKLPGFTANASVSNATNHYSGAGGKIMMSSIEPAVTMQALTCDCHRDCGGDTCIWIVMAEVAKCSLSIGLSDSLRRSTDVKVWDDVINLGNNSGHSAGAQIALSTEPPMGRGCLYSVD